MIIILVILATVGFIRLIVVNNTYVSSTILHASLRNVYSAMEQYKDTHGKLPDTWKSLLKETDLELSAIYPPYPSPYLRKDYSFKPVYYFPQSATFENTGSRILLASPHPRLGKRGVILFDDKFHLSPSASIEYIDEKDFQNYLKQNKWSR